MPYDAFDQVSNQSYNSRTNLPPLQQTKTRSLKDNRAEYIPKDHSDLSSY